MTVAEVGEDNAVAMVKLDDGKMNAFSFDMISAIDGAMEDCRDAGAIVISGNEKCLSGECVDCTNDSHCDFDPAVSVCALGSCTECSI